MKSKSGTHQKQGLLRIKLIGLGLISFWADMLGVFSRQVVSHLVAVDNPWHIVDTESVVKRNLNLVKVVPGKREVVMTFGHL